MKKLGFLSFGHWTPSSQSQVRTASDALLQSIDLAVAAEQLGARWRLFPRASLRAPARLAVSAARRGGGAHLKDRARHRRHRHALREPAVHGGGRRRGRSDFARASATRHFARLAGAGDRRLPPFRLRAGGGHDRRRHGARPHAKCFSTCCAGRALPSPILRRCFRTRRGCCGSSLFRRACASASGGAPAPMRRRNGRPSSA